MNAIATGYGIRMNWADNMQIALVSLLMLLLLLRLILMIIRWRRRYSSLGILLGNSNEINENRLFCRHQLINYYMQDDLPGD